MVSRQKKNHLPLRHRTNQPEKAVVARRDGAAVRTDEMDKLPQVQRLHFFLILRVFYDIELMYYFSKLFHVYFSLLNWSFVSFFTQNYFSSAWKTDNHNHFWYNMLHNCGKVYGPQTGHFTASARLSTKKSQWNSGSLPTRPTWVVLFLTWWSTTHHQKRHWYSKTVPPPEVPQRSRNDNSAVHTLPRSRAHSSENEYNYLCALLLSLLGN